MQRRRKRSRTLLKILKRSFRFFDLSNYFKPSIRATRWLLPGLVVKRWLFISSLGFLIGISGLIIWAEFRPIYWVLEILFWLLGAITTFIPINFTGPFIFLIGIGLLIFGQSRSFQSISDAVAPEKDTFLVDALLAKSKLNRGPNILAIGGGTGLSSLLKGLKRYSSNITAIVTVADDGGSSGILRRELGVQPPGDIRNCITALSSEEQLMTRLFQYRFSSGNGLEGHSFGNLFLSALTSITGNFENAITASSRILAVQGKVLPATNVDVRLWAELENGEKIYGESAIGQSSSPIVRVGCIPERPPALSSAIEAINNAEIIILGPGSLYTSLLPNLLVPEIVEAIQRSNAPKLYICNLMTQPGETDGLDVEGHIRAIESQLASLGITKRIFKTILAQADLAESPLVDYYRYRGSEPVICNREKLIEQGYRVIQMSLQGDRSSATLKHDPKSLSIGIMRFYRRYRKEPKLKNQ